MLFGVKMENSISLKIIKESKSSKFISLIALLCILFSITLSLLEIKFNYSKYVIMSMFLIGFLILVRLKISTPVNQIGYFNINFKEIDIIKNKIQTTNSIQEIKKIDLNLKGKELELKKNWNILSKEIFPFEEGYNNTIKITLNNDNTLESNFYLNSIKTEKKLIRILTNVSLKYNIELNIY